VHRTRLYADLLINPTEAMGIYEPEKVKLGDVEGIGYAFTRRTAFGKAFQGVFFTEDEEALEQLQDQDEVTFTGAVYHRRRDRSARKKEESLTVSIIDTVSTPMGERAEFEAIDNPTP
jgi:hypothetical protein